MPDGPKRAIDALSQQLGDEIQKEREALAADEARVKRSRQELDDERARMSAFQDRPDADRDVIELNVGGEVVATKRGTLLLARNSLLEALFSGRWEGSVEKDAAGRVFLDFSPAVFRVLLSHFRVLRDAAPEQVVAPPTVPPELKAEFESMVHFFGVKDAVYGKFCVVSQEALRLRIPACGLKLGVSVDGSNASGGPNKHSPVVGCDVLASGLSKPAVICWKVYVRHLEAGGWFYAGLISNPEPTQNSHGDATSFGWAGQAYCKGKTAPKHDWDRWQTGDEAIFKLDPGKQNLRMLHKRAQKTQLFTLDGITAWKEMRIHLNIHSTGTQVEVSSVTEHELGDF